MGAPARRAGKPDAAFLPALAALALAGAAWAVIAWGDATPGAGDHHAVHAGDASVRVAFGTGAWALMIIAMMLPQALPFARTVGRLVAARPRRRLLVGAALAGVLVPWLLVGPLILGLDELAGAALGAPGGDATPDATLSGAALALAGAYQLSPWKRAGLAACRSPFGIVARYWSGSPRPLAPLTAAGIAYGVSCVTCCWVLMLAMVAASAGALLWMIALAVAMAAERLAPSGERLAAPLGAVLIGAGLAILLG